jgi:hypothetical protein
VEVRILSKLEGFSPETDNVAMQPGLAVKNESGVNEKKRGIPEINEFDALVTS